MKKKIIIIVSAVVALVTGCIIGYSLIDRRKTKKSDDLLED